MGRAAALIGRVVAAGVVAVLIAALCVDGVAARGRALPVRAWQRARRGIAEHLAGARGQPTGRDGFASGVGPAPSFFMQYQDHFDGSNTRTWQQEYFVNDTFWTGAASGAPVFLCVGGEGPPLTGASVVNSVHCSNAAEWLPETGALMLALQHRYYGCFNASACPVPDVSAPGALKFLSSRQAVGDVARFLEVVAQQYSLTSANKIVSWGGSYPGMLASFVRLKLPHLVHAAVSSSAPVQAQLDMRGYFDVVAAAYAVSDNDVGGSAACESNIREGHATIKSMFATDTGRQRLASLFGQTADWYADQSNQAAFAGGGVANFPAQENDPSTTQPCSNIGLICKVMTDASVGDNVQRLAEVRKQQMGWVPAEHRSAVAGEMAMQEEAPQDAPDYWGYQTCTEWAFFQTCEVGSRCFFAQGYMLLDSYIQMCQETWSIDQEIIQRNVNYSNAYYGGWNPAGSCVLYVNGEVDPWHALSVLKSPSEGLPILFVPGASHHFWTHASLPTDQPSVVQARQSIRKTVTGFLSQDCLQATPSGGTLGLV